MSGTVLLDPSRLKLDVFRTDRSSITAVMASRSTNASCPLCGIPSSRVHSRYVRILADLLWHDVAVFARHLSSSASCSAAKRALECCAAEPCAEEPVTVTYVSENDTNDWCLRPRLVSHTHARSKN